jgi:CheY-like chemotaxis protein
VEQSRRQPAQFAEIDPAQGIVAARSVSAPAPKRTRKRALVVEASASSLKLCRDILERSGFAVEIAGSGIAALTSAREKQPDLIVMDLQLPDVPGREFIGWLRGIPVLRSTPIIVLAGAAAETAELAQFGPNSLLRKPASALVIHRTIQEATKSD